MGAEAYFFLELAHMPSSVKGQTRFDIGLLQASPEIMIDENLALLLRFVLAEERSGTENNYLNELQNAFVRYRDIRFKGLTHELGLVRSAWIISENSASELDFFGDSGRSLARRYKMIGEGELGYQARYQQDDKIEWVLGFGNGEENKQEEQGPNKEAVLGTFYRHQDLVLQLWISTGRVDRLDSKLNEKNRVFVRAHEKWGRFSLGIEGVYAQDPSMDLETYGRLEGITFTELLQPQEIKTYGGRMNLGYDLSEKQRFILRFDQITPLSAKKRIQSFGAAWTQRESQNMVWGLFYEKTEFGAQHSTRSKLRELARLGLEIAF